METTRRPAAEPDLPALVKPQAERMGKETAVAPKEVVYTSHRANNDVLFQKVEQMYFKKGDRIADVTYGKGVFWKRLKKEDYICYWSDIVTYENYQEVAKIDFRHLPYGDDFLDALVLDPPYHHTGNNPRQNERDYQNISTTPNHSHSMILDLYKAGMKEAFRVLKKGGLLFVKCADEIESGKQRRLHIELYQYAMTELSMLDQDFFQLTQVNDPHRYHKRQLHAHNNISYLWVFKKERRMRKMANSVPKH